ncbi:SDR family NAD(P)-dependent oxidoreductase [Conexibacter sp. CPCC 206217]|uniref:SDR family NAD(P)-dependent oxidoreductase n=1 Tax=Conexibacter sp. CPCC 206217 TaxID=3064574 RepID=UPI002723D149|nr:SDR family oxidoreductase [Conexibacter sp. CPCC 206217]MDO8212665.1 SDR family oxidoreductase [Conexibacter sp. CPCC 206217]
MSAQRFEGRRALVTGAGSGIGRATAQRLMDEGAEVLGVDLNEDGLKATFADAEAGAGRGAAGGGTWAALDVGAPQAPALMRERGPFDVLVNAAGILRRHDVLDHPLDGWEATLDVNVRAAFRLCRELARERVAAGAPGAIVNVCSIESFTALPAHAAYTASKAAILMLTRSFALELAPHGVRVNGIAPGVTETGMNERLRADAEGARRLAAGIPMRRFGRPEEQAAAICFLASGEASYITGSVLAVDGGWLTR